MDLPAAGGIERGFPQNNSRTRLLSGGRCDVFDYGIEFVHFRTIVVKTFSHDETGSHETLPVESRASRPATPKLNGRDARSSAARLAATSKRKVRHRRSTAHERARYRCFLPDLAGLAGKRRAEPMPDSISYQEFAENRNGHRFAGGHTFVVETRLAASRQRQHFQLSSCNV